MPRTARPGTPRAAAVAAALAVLVAVAAGCAAAPRTAAPSATATPQPVFIPRTIGATPTPTATPPRNLTDGGVMAILQQAVCWYADPALGPKCTPPGPDVVAAIETMAQSGDQRFIAPLVDMLSLDVGWSRYCREALLRITGQQLADGNAWYAWVAQHQPPLPQGYATWKGHLLSLVDPRFARLIDDQLGGAVRPDELIWGQVAVDGLPPLVGPQRVHRSEERYLADGDIVYGLFLNEDRVAYPERILAWHEIVSDVVGGADVLIVDCATCGSAAAFRRTASDGTTYTFGTSGLVYRSRRLLFDEQTHSLWDPLSGAAIAGPAAAAGVHLIALPLLRTTWADWSARHPATEVLALDTGFVRDYSAGAATKAVDAAPGPLYPAGTVDNRLGAKDRVLGIVVNGAARAYPLAKIQAAGFVHDRVGGQDVLLVSLGAGTGVSVFDESDVTFTGVEGPPDALEVTSDDGLRWFMDERRLLNARNGRVRNAFATRTVFWFAWSADYPDTSVWGQ